MDLFHKMMDDIAIHHALESALPWGVKEPEAAVTVRTAEAVEQIMEVKEPEMVTAPETAEKTIEVKAPEIAENVVELKSTHRRTAGEVDH